MVENDAIQIIYRELVEEEGILVQLSLKQGIDQSRVKSLKEAISYLTEFYKHKNTVPKILAGIFVDLTPCFERCLELYTENEQYEILNLRDEIVELGLKLFEMKK